MKGTSKFYIFIGLIALVSALIFWFSSHQPKAFEPESRKPGDELSDRNIVRIQVDSLTRIIREVYGNDAAVSQTDVESMTVKVQNQGNEISNFYNDNPRLLDVKDQRFSIKRNGNSVDATFKVEVLNGNKYAFVPTDVVYKLSELAYNK